MLCLEYLIKTPSRRMILRTHQSHLEQKQGQIENQGARLMTVHILLPKLLSKTQLLS